jgi:beta-lactamase class A
MILATEILFMLSVMLQGCNGRSNASIGQEAYPLLSPRIFVEHPNDILINFNDLRRQIREYVARIPERTGVYFEYLPSGAGIGVNDREEFVAASLIKVPLVFGAYLLIEEKKIDERQAVRIEERHLDKSYGTLWKRGAGYSLTVEELVEQILEHSDNTAANALYETLLQSDGQIIERVFENLDIPFELSTTHTAVVSPKNYSSILRSLYLSSMLQKEHTARILQFMMQADAREQIVAGVPEGVPVAHKNGVYESGDRIVHSDCGIVYIPRRPYVLCMMSDALEVRAKAQMREISKMAYDFVSNAVLPPQGSPGQ